MLNNDSAFNAFLGPSLYRGVFLFLLFGKYLQHSSFFLDQVISGGRKITSHLVTLTWMNKRKALQAEKQKSLGAT